MYRVCKSGVVAEQMITMLFKTFTSVTSFDVCNYAHVLVHHAVAKARKERIMQL